MNDVEVNDAFDDLDAAMASKKRGREAAIAEQEAIEAADQKNRGNYRCSRCNLPKKGHVCPFQPRYKRRDQANDVGAAMVRDDATQVELDEHMTLRALGELDKQGTSESYFSAAAAAAAAAQSPHKVSLSTLNESFQNVKVDR